MAVHRELGSGLREKPYENALMIALQSADITASQQKAFPIRFQGKIVGDCIPDITLAEMIIDTKSIDRIGDAERAQILNYLRISGKRVGLIINFKNTSLEWERFVR